MNPIQPPQAKENEFSFQHKKPNQIVVGARASTKELKRGSPLSSVAPMKPVLSTLLCACSLLAALSLAAADKTYTIAVVPKGTTHEFWKSINAGAVKAQRELTEK